MKLLFSIALVGVAVFASLPAPSTAQSTPSGTLPAPTVSISASPLSITAGEFSTLSWTASDAASSCTASGAWEGLKALSDSERVAPSSTSTYTLTCTGQGGSATDSVTVEVTSAAALPPATSDIETTTETVTSGGTTTTDTEGDGATASDPIETTVTSPVAGQVTITERPTATPGPAGFSLLAREVQITAPSAPAGNPLILSFQLNLSLVPAATNPNTIRVFKDRVLLENCPGEPCAASVSVSGGSVTLTVHTLEASTWSFGHSLGAAAGGLVPCGGAGQPACTLCHTLELTKNILDIFLFPIVPIVASLLVAIGGFFIFTAAANPQNVNKGRTILFAVVIGLLIIYGAWLFIGLLFQSIGVAAWTGLGTWWRVECSVPAPPPPPVVYSSCEETLANGGSTGDGIYTINPTGSQEISVWCDMTTDGGGWTLAARLYDDGVAMLYGDSEWTTTGTDFGSPTPNGAAHRSLAFGTLPKTELMVCDDGTFGCNIDNNFSGSETLASSFAAMSEVICDSAKVGLTPDDYPSNSKTAEVYAWGNNYCAGLWHSNATYQLNMVDEDRILPPSNPNAPQARITGAVNCDAIGGIGLSFPTEYPGICNGFPLPPYTELYVR